MKKSIFFFTVAIFLTAGLNAQSITVADSTNVNQFIPVWGSGPLLQKSRILYPDTMLSELIGKHITSLTFYFNTTPSSAWGGIQRLRIGVTLSSNLQNGFDSANLTQVWMGTLSDNISGNTLSITLDNPFPYTGGNLLIERENLTATPGSSGGSFYGMNQNTQLSHIATYDSPTESWASGYSFLPKTTFAYEESCFAPLYTQSSLVSPGTVLLSWAADPILPAAFYTVGYKTASDTVFTEITTSDTFLLLSGLQNATNYEWRVQSHCNIIGTSDWNNAGTFTTAQPATLPYMCDFENAVERDSWQFLNYNYPNKWYISNAVSNGGDYSMYVSKNGGVSNSYNSYVISYAWAYRDVYFDPSDSGYTLSFDIRSNGTGNYSLQTGLTDVFLGPPVDPSGKFAPAGATKLATGLCGIWNWTNKSYLLDHSYAGMQRLYFFWRNKMHSIVCNPPAAIDNISIEGTPCITPVELSAYFIMDTLACLSWTMPSNNFDYFTIAYKSLTDTVFSYITAQGAPFILGNLSPSTTYIWKVRSHCNATETGFWSEESTFQTKENTGRIPYFCDFEDATENKEWYFSTSSSSNIWVIGNAVNNGGDSSLYVSKDNGATNTYTNMNICDTWAYRDIYLNPGYPSYTISFDCRAHGNYYPFGTLYENESCLAYALAYLGLPNNLTPIGDTIWLNSSWHNVSFQLDSSFAGPQCLCFQWYNDYCYVQDPPGAIDNIAIIGKKECFAPHALIVDSTSTNSISIQFAPATDEDHAWQAVIAEANQPLDTTQIIALTDTTYTFNGLQGNTAYTIFLRTDCGSSQSNWCSITQWTDTIPDGVILHDMDHLLFLYPNPTNGKCTISNEQGLIETVELYDTFGKRLKFSQVNDCKAEIDLSTCAAGLYFVHVTTDQGKITVRVAKR